MDCTENLRGGNITTTFNLEGITGVVNRDVGSDRRAPRIYNKPQTSYKHIVQILICLQSEGRGGETQKHYTHI